MTTECVTSTATPPTSGHPPRGSTQRGAGCFSQPRGGSGACQKPEAAPAPQRGSPGAAAPTCSPGSAQGHGVTGAPVCGGKAAPSRAGWEGQDKTSRFPEQSQGDPLHPDPSCIPHSCPFPSPRAGTDSACLFLPTETTALQIPPANATRPSPAAGEQEPGWEQGSQVQHPRPCTTPHPLLRFHPKPPQNPIIN